MSGVAQSYGQDDVTTAGGSSGGEWYDIEAVYLSLETSGSHQYVNWAMVTSYGGVDVPSDASPHPYLPSGTSSVADLRDGVNGAPALDYPYRRHPVLALRFNASPTWDYGIVMAPSWDYSGYDASGNPVGTSAGLVDPHVYGAYATNPDAAGWQSSISPTPELWNVATWRDGHPNEFGTGTYSPTHGHPIDFDVNDGAHHQLSTNGQVYAGTLSGYEEEWYQQVGGGWYQRDNWVWEGWVRVPTTSDSSWGVDFDAHTAVSFHYGVWCANNTTFGDRIVFDEPGNGRDDAPELGTWALLLATGALGGWAKRRRRRV